MSTDWASLEETTNNNERAAQRARRSFDGTTNESQREGLDREQLEASTMSEYTRKDRKRDDKIIADCMTRLNQAKASRMTDAQLDANIRTYPEQGANASWRAICVAERATRPAGPHPMSAVEQRIRARAAQ